MEGPRVREKRKKQKKEVSVNPLYYLAFDKVDCLTAL